MKKPRRPKPVFDLPSPEEANAAAAELSGTPLTVKPSSPTAKKRVAKKKNVSRKKTIGNVVALDKNTETAFSPPITKKPIGRPRANHGRRSTSIMVRAEIWKRLKLLAVQRDIDLSEMLEDLFLVYLNREEKRRND